MLSPSTLYRSFITLSREYSETLATKGFTQESMFRALCEELKSKSLTVSGFGNFAFDFSLCKVMEERYKCRLIQLLLNID
jgi:hypothetical protein